MKIERQGENFVIKGVAIFDGVSDESRPDVTSQGLESYVRNTNAVIRRRGDGLPVTCDSMAGTVGSYKNLKLGTLNGSSRPAVLADIHIKPKHWKHVDQFQRRQVEAFVNDNELGELKLLGSRAPQRDLGRLTPVSQYSRNDRFKETYEMNDQPERYDRDTPKASQAECNAIAELAVEMGVTWDHAKRLYEDEYHEAEHYERYGQAEQYNPCDTERITASEAHLIAELADVQKIGWNEAKALVLESR